MSLTPLSIWEKESFFAPADIVIAGSGFVGLWSAFYLKRANPRLSITIVERGMIPTGASTRNAGFACFGSLTELIADAAAMGEDKMLDLVEMRYKGIRRIRKTFSDKKTGYKAHGGYELIADPAGSSLASAAPDMNILRSHMDRLNPRLKKITGAQKTFRLRDDKLAGFGFAGIRHLIETRGEGQLHPGKLCQSLLRAIQSGGVTVLTHVGIKRYERVNGRLHLETDEGPVIKAGQLLICTNGFARQLLPQLDSAPARGQILVTAPLENLPFRGSFHFDEGFYYFRDLGDRVLLGGARNKDLQTENTDEMTVTDKIQQELEKFLYETILPGRSVGIDYRWSGIMGMGKEKTPLTRRVGHGVWCAVRMSGIGVAMAPIIGEKMAEMMLGGEEKEK